MFAHMGKSAVERGKRVLIIVHRQELLKQASKSLEAIEVPHDIIGRMQASRQETCSGIGFEGSRGPLVSIASVQTLDRRLKKEHIPFDFIIVDEAHHVGARTWLRVLSHYPDAHLLGVTATPVRLDGRGLGSDHGGLFDDLVHGPSISDLTEAGHLVPSVLYAYPTVDVTGVKRFCGDYSTKELTSRVDQPKITGCAVEHYGRHASGEPAIAFCASLEHAEHVAQGFRDGGYTSRVIHGGLGDDERSEMIADLGRGKIQVLASVDLISEGTDIPVCSVAILLRATQSVSLYLQQVGRILRPAPGKTRGLVLDHVGNCLRHGLPEEDRQWSLKGIPRQAQDKEALPLVRQCKKCFAVWRQGTECPHCGHVNVQLETRAVPKTQGGELEIMSAEKLLAFKRDKRIAYARAQTFDEVKRLTREFGDKPGYAYMYWNARLKKRRGV
jgi:DNA repair protein RadD